MSIFCRCCNLLLEIKLCLILHQTTCFAMNLEVKDPAKLICCQLWNTGVELLKMVATNIDVIYLDFQ